MPPVANPVPTPEPTPTPQPSGSPVPGVPFSNLPKLENAPKPGFAQAAVIIQISQTTGVDSTLFSATWFLESSFESRPKNGPHNDRGGADIGPGQLYPGVWDKAPFTSGLKDPFGSNREIGQKFNGDPVDNLLLTAYALNSIPGSRAEKAGLYKAGKKSGPGYQTRVNEFDKLSGGYDAFYACLRQLGF